MGRAASKALRRTTHSSSHRFQATAVVATAVISALMKGAYRQPITHPKPNWDLRVAEQGWAQTGCAGGKGNAGMSRRWSKVEEDLNLNRWR
ncbi:unnamed protein product [Fusarium graminearum]|uniref:Chromosome 4, complete genome n=1 Tax=Gibberella zeae (strain ATCC MYA-4620 / CBS 123657 / FGSC 9075 / NRRL 31084 / PH-1) TaxID=229533 RepID=A0A0E0SBQ8_GIBZE|nr:hypothetical protein FG05_30525 [Fusarium graminearum]CEF83871.1 unnamed protein product [Fusarium graminearum]CZS72741.1 unnamed protein product [Fusarium graminearum]